MKMHETVSVFDFVGCFIELILYINYSCVLML